MDLRHFLGNLRQLGFNIAIAEQIEAHRLLGMVESSIELKYGLRMLICQSYEEQNLFDFIWDGIYPEQTKNPESNESEQTQRFVPGVGFDGNEGMGLALARSDSPYKGVARQLLQGNNRNAAAMMMRFIFANRDPAYREEIVAEVREIIDSITDSEAYLQHLDEQLRLLMQEYLETPDKIRNPLQLEDIDDKPLITLQQSSQLSQALKVLGRKLASKHKRKRKGHRLINFRKTIRANVQHGGILLDLQRQVKRVDRPKLFLVTDVSPSTIQATRLFLTIIWHAKEVFSDIRYYEFIGSCLDVTPEFRRAKSVDSAMNASLIRWRRTVGGKENSDYYTAFRMFEKLATDKLSSRSTILILGDMRDWLGPWKDGKPMSASILKKLRPKVRRLIVLNPEPKSLWDSGDSICKFCIVHDIEIYETTNLGQLIKVLLHTI